MTIRVIDTTNPQAQGVQQFVVGPDGLDDEDRAFLEQYRNGLDTTGRAQVEGEERCLLACEVCIAVGYY